MAKLFSLLNRKNRTKGNSHNSLKNPLVHASSSSSFSRLEDAFILSLIDFQYGQIDEAKISCDAQTISWAKGWPQSPEAFWNVEAFMWSRKIPLAKRELIRATMLSEYQKLMLNDTIDDGSLTLDLGCGAYSYMDFDVGFDFSARMLAFNSSVEKTIVGNLGQTWPFANDSCRFVSACFVLNYLEDIDFVLKEALRILLKDGLLFVTLSATGVSSLHQMQEKQRIQFEEWRSLFSRYFSFVNAFEQDGLWFFVCTA